MFSITRIRPLAAALVCLSVGCLVGCSKPQDLTKDTQESHMKPLAILYGRYIGQHQGRPPRDKAAFKSFIESQGKEYLEHLGVKNADDLFISERDGEPYVVHYGKLDLRSQRLGGFVTMYEKKGADGLRFVASELGTIEKLTDEEFAQAVPKAK